jgi:cation diffusion facilitator family transporter
MRVQRTERAELVSMGASVVMAAGMIAVAAVSHSVSILAEGIDTVTDLVASLAVLIGLRLSLRHSRNFPAGLYKLENLIGTAIGIFILFCSYELAAESIRRLVSGEDKIDQGWLVLLTMVVVLLITAWLAWYKARVGREEHSPSLLADAKHTWTDAIACLAIVVGVGLEMLGVPRMDAVAALVVVAFLVKAGIEVTLDGIKVLLDASVEREVLDEVESIVKSDRRVRDIVSVQGRNSGRFRFLYLQLVPVSFDLREAEAAAADLKEKIRAGVENVDQISIDFTVVERERVYVALPLEEDGSTVSLRLGDARDFGLLEVALPGLEVTVRERVANPARDAVSGREVRAAVFLSRQGAEVVLVRESLAAGEARFVFEPNGVAWLERPEAASMELAEGALREYAATMLEERGEVPA